MKTGDPILIEVDGKWRRGSFLAQRVDSEGKADNQHEMLYKVGIGEPHYFNYEEKEVYPHSVKRFIPLSEENAKAKHDADLIPMTLGIQAALAELLPGETIETKEGSIVGYHGGVTLDPVVYETPRIGVAKVRVDQFVQETAGWQVHVVHYHYATRHQPEEYEPVEVGEPSNWQQAMKLFVETIFKQKAHDYWEHMAEGELAMYGDAIF